MAKLTLSVDDDAIKAAKEWAKAQGISVSQMVSTFFVSLASSKKPPDEMPPILKKLAGILEQEDATIENYHYHLVNKYL